MKKTAAAIILILIASRVALLAQGTPAGAARDSVELVRFGGDSSLLVFPALRIGTHEGMAGLTLMGLANFRPGNIGFGIGAFVSCKIYGWAWGPGVPSPAAFQFSAGLHADAGFGSPARAPSLWPDAELRSAMTVRLGWTVYADGWHTGQASGHIGFALAGRRWSLGLLFHDDFFAFLNRDEYRTGALELGLGFGVLDVDCVAALGFRIWTGAAVGSLDRGETYDMSLSPVGGNHSAGLVYAAFRSGAFGIEVGWDSEAIRDVLQNGTHWILDDGRVPLLDRPDRLYVDFSLFRDGDLY